MNIKCFSILIVILLVIFGIGYSLGSILSEDGNPSLKIFNNIKYGKAPLTVSFSSKIFNLNEKIKKYEWKTVTPKLEQIYEKEFIKESRIKKE